MRAYFFGNMYLSSIQQGIQAAHVVGDMFVKYRMQDDECPQNILYKWAEDYKTMILLSAGYSEEIYNLEGFFKSGQNPYPWASFHEGVDALDGALTCVGIILPEEIYNASKSLRSPPIGATVGDFLNGTYDPWNGYKPNEFELALVDKLNTYPLAR